MTRKYEDIVNIRAIAIIIVMIGHSIILYSSNWDLYEPDSPFLFFDYLKRFIDAFQMPLFFSLSGYLYVFSKTKFSFMGMLLDKSMRLLIPYLFVGCFYMVPIKMILHYKEYEGMSYVSILLRCILFGKSNGHLWYLPALFIIFLICNLFFLVVERFLKIQAKFHLYAYLILLALSIMTRSFLFELSFEISFFQKAIYYLPFFLVGCIICTQKTIVDKANQKNSIKLASIIVFVLVAVISVYINKSSVLGSTVLVVCIYIFIPRKTNKSMSFIDKNSFGLYLFHSPLIYFMFVYKPNINPIIFALISFVGLGSLALAATLLIRKIGFGILIGEKRKDLRMI